MNTVTHVAHSRPRGTNRSHWVAALALALAFALPGGPKFATPVPPPVLIGVPGGAGAVGIAPTATCELCSGMGPVPVPLMADAPVAVPAVGIVPPKIAPGDPVEPLVVPDDTAPAAACVTCVVTVPVPVWEADDVA